MIVEDGSIVANADSYSTVAAADTYWTDRNNPDAWSNAIDSEKEAALIIATQYLDITYHTRWKGYPTSSEQSLDWPRINVVRQNGSVYDSDEMPVALLQATAEMALRSIEGVDLFPDLDTSGAIKRTMDKAGPVETETEYVGGASGIPVFPTVGGLLISGDLIDASSNRVYRG